MMTQLPETRGEYAVVASKNGSIVHNGELVYNTEPIEKGFWTRFFTPSGVCYAGPFETNQDAWLAGKDFADYRGNLEIQ